jgi:CRP-like cAMP-binding protein
MIELSELRKQILLQGLEEEDYLKLSTLLEYKVYQKDETIFKESDPSEGIYLIKSGRVRISKAVQGGRRRTLIVFRDYNYFGELSALEKRAHSATATALVDTELFLLKSENLACHHEDTMRVSCKIHRRLALIASKNLKQMNERFLRLGESF